MPGPSGACHSSLTHLGLCGQRPARPRYPFHRETEREQAHLSYSRNRFTDCVRQRTDARLRIVDFIGMQAATKIRILSVEWVNGGVMIRFDDGTSVFYSAALLHEIAPRAEVIEDDPSW